MKCYLGLITAALFLAALPPAIAQDQSYNHVEIGAFADYFRFQQTSPVSNFVGVGGRVAFNLRPSIQLEAEMAYDFQRNFTNVYNNGISSQDVSSNLRTLHGLFGPKLQTGSGAFRLFVTGKVGFDNFTVNNQNAPAGFTSAVGLNNGTTDFAVYPGGGVEAFAGPIGLRLEAGDEIYFNNGAHNNLKVTFGPQFRF
jgi:hypothetical protein